MRLIVALAIAACVATLAAAVLAPTTPLARSLLRVRLARGAAGGGVRDRLRQVPVLGAWTPVDAETLRLAGVGGLTTTDLGLAKVGAAIAVTLVALTVGAPAAVVAPVAFVAFVAPSEWVRRRATSRQAARRDAVLPLLERMSALASSGMTVEQALLRLAEVESPLAVLLREVSARAEFGVSPFDALMELAERDRASELRDLARELARARYGGRPLLPVLAERRDLLRLARRAERLEAASRVDGALSLVLVLAYLPAMLLLVVIPLFLGLLRSLNG